MKFQGLAGSWARRVAQCQTDCTELLQQFLHSPVAPIDRFRLFDRLSQRLCSVIDSAEFCRNVVSDDLVR
jgi:hypothetical protein